MPTKKVIDAKEAFISPGFIDIHTHSDISLYIDSRGLSKVKQGVTTDVTGNINYTKLNDAVDNLHKKKLYAPLFTALNRNINFFLHSYGYNLHNFSVGGPISDNIKFFITLNFI